MIKTRKTQNSDTPMRDKLENDGFSEDKVLCLGKILRQGREAKGYTRHELSWRSGVSQNSIVRYERAGIDEDGQIPPANKLAKLAIELGLDPLILLQASLSGADQFVAGNEFKINRGNPYLTYIKDQYLTLLHENHLMRTFLQDLLSPKQEGHGNKSLLEKLDMVVQIFNAQSNFENKMIKSGNFMPIAREYDHPSCKEDMHADWKYQGATDLHLANAKEIADKLGVKYEAPNFYNDRSDRQYPHVSSADELWFGRPDGEEEFQEAVSTYRKTQPEENKESSGSLQTAPSSLDDEKN